VELGVVLGEMLPKFFKQAVEDGAKVFIVYTGGGKN
jgi:hypothetical protein